MQRKSLQQKISEKIPWKWTEEDSEVVVKLKEMCNKLPELYNPSDDDILIVSTDECVTHWGATLTVLCGKKSETIERIKELITQKTSLEQDKLIKYSSGTFTNTQQKHPIHELETSAAIKTFKNGRLI